MNEKIIEILTADGRMETFITYPEQGGPFVPIVIYMDVWGLREELYDIARKVAVVGYYVLLPDLYYRQGRIRYQWRNECGQMISMHNLDSNARLRCAHRYRSSPTLWSSPIAGRSSILSRRASPFAAAASARSAIAWAAAT
jgi:dienelactone hydrolase